MFAWSVNIFGVFFKKPIYDFLRKAEITVIPLVSGSKSQMCKCRNVTIKYHRTSPKMKRRLTAAREESSSKSTRNSDLAIYVMVTTTAVLSYVNSLNGDFVHDDIPAVVTNGDVVGSNSLKQLLLDDFWGTPMADANSHKSYRPLTTLSFR